jgi:hypothetical protein
MQQQLLQKPQIETIGKHIGYEAGEEMVKSFYDKHPDQAYGHIVGRELIEKILGQPDCVGIGLLPAYNDKNIRQVVLVGLDKNGKPILQYNVVNMAGEISTEEGIIGDRLESTGWAI